MFPTPLSVIRDDPTPIDVNCTQGVQWIWTVFRECAVTPKEITAVSFGLISAFIWIVFAFPQIIENCRKGIPDQALSPIMLLCFILGDTINLLGCIFVHQLPLQVIMATIGVTSDLIQISQFLYYMFMRKRMSQNVATLTEVTSSGDSDNSAQVRTRSSATVVLCLTLGVICFFSPNLPTFEANIIPSYFSSSVQTRKLFQSAVTITTPMPIPEPLFPTSGLLIGYVLGWISTCIYMSSRVSQIHKNWRRGSTEGLSPITFILAICGNTSYALQLLLTSLDRVFIIRSLPWIVGSINCVLLDLTVCELSPYSQTSFLVVDLCEF
ncbi:unnamed protein product [Hymenolepis diminuta]|uniref:PQ-loop repeat-containing protein 2 n=1 Tax=Hymenolepis diminuta TaxID=6216 RepID=A0A0R3SE61_HYMDI|nr:unnamed protein product [Hymenolepis diminuta]